MITGHHLRKITDTIINISGGEVNRPGRKKPARRCGIGQAPASPDEGNEPVFHLFHILLIAGKALPQDLLLIEYAPGDNGEIGQHYDEGNNRPQHQGHGQEEHHRGHVHGVPHKAVEPRIYDLLILLDLHGPGKIGVLPQDLRKKAVGSQEQDRSRNAHRPGQHEKAEAEAQGGGDEGGNEHDSAV